MLAPPPPRAKTYAKEAKDPELIAHAVEVRMRAERKVGQLLIDMA